MKNLLKILFCAIFFLAMAYVGFALRAKEIKYFAGPSCNCVK